MRELIEELRITLSALKKPQTLLVSILFLPIMPLLWICWRFFIWLSLLKVALTVIAENIFKIRIKVKIIDPEDSMLKIIDKASTNLAKLIILGINNARISKEKISAAMLSFAFYVSIGYSVKFVILFTNWVSAYANLLVSLKNKSPTLVFWKSIHYTKRALVNALNITFKII